jgi:uncharacterized membrane protein YphA (DoxX/SURF4 family)
MRLGVSIYALATVAAGLFDLLWGEFEAAHQPIQAWGDHIPGQQAFAYITAVWLIVAGTAILWRPTARAGALACAAIYFIFVLFWPPRFLTAPRVLGYTPGIYIGVLGGVAQQLILVAAALVVYATTASLSPQWQRKLAGILRWTFGLCSINFGLAHLTGIQVTASFVPKWMPLGANFWTVLTGVAFLMAGLAILCGILDVLAARLLALMLLVFSVLVLTPPILVMPHDHVAWGANAYNLAAVGAVWIFAESIASRAPGTNTVRLPLADAS